MSIIKEFREFAMRGNVGIWRWVSLSVRHSGRLYLHWCRYHYATSGLINWRDRFQTVAVTLRDAQGDIPAVVMHYGASFKTSLIF